MNELDVLENEKACVLRNVSGCDKQCAECDLALPDSMILNAYDKAIDALRAQQEHEKGCPYCNGTPIMDFPDCDYKVYLMEAKNGTGLYYLDCEKNGELQFAIHINNCPMCGKPLTKEKT